MINEFLEQICKEPDKHTLHKAKLAIKKFCLFLISKVGICINIIEIKSTKDEKKFTGKFIEDSQIMFANEEIGVVKATVNNAATSTAKGYFAIFIFQ